jgi:hypothetical protein
MRRTKLLLALAASVIALGPPAAAIAQSAGDEQYIDPFAQSGGGGGHKGGSSKGGKSNGSASQSGSGSSQTAGAQAGGDGGTSGSGSASASGDASSGDGSLPLTGYGLEGPFVLGVVLLGSGFVLRRRLA